MKKNNSLITVITISYNAVDNIESTIQSVLNQTYPFIEYIIIDGGSSDGTTEIIKKYVNNISFWLSEQDKGIYDAMNKGIMMASGDWINFMNAGDAFYNPNTINSLSYYLENKTIGVIYGDVKIIYDQNHVKTKRVKTNNFLKGMPFCTQSAFVRNKYFSDILFNDKYNVFGDLDYFLSLNKKKVQMKYVKKVIASFDYNGVSSRFLLKNELEKLGILKKHLGYVGYAYSFSIIDRFIRHQIKKILPLEIIRKLQLSK